jgi:hypothetical protein
MVTRKKSMADKTRRSLGLIEDSMGFNLLQALGEDLPDPPDARQGGGSLPHS